MKKKLKQISKALLLCSMLYFTSCVNDDFINNNDLEQNNSNYQFKKISFNELKLNRKAFQKLKDVQKKNTSMQYRGVYNDDFGVFIDTTNIVIIEKDGKHSITFKILDEENQNKIENLILKSNIDGSYDAFISEYILSQEEIIKIENGEALDTKIPNSIQEVSSLNRIDISGPCITSTTTTEFICHPANGGEPISYGNSYSGGCNGTMEYKVTQIIDIDTDCLGGGDGGSSGGGFDGGGNDGGGNYSGPGNNGGGSGSTGGGSSTGGENTGTPNTGNPPSGENTGNPTNADPTLTDSDGNPILTTPILESDPNERKLKRISNNTYVKAKINELRAKCTNPNQLTEDGAQYIKSGSGYTERLPDATFPDETRFDPSFVPNVEVVIHMHELQTYIVDPTGQNPPELVNIVPVFSDGDIYAFLGLAEYTNYANDNITAIVVTPAGTFAMRMDDASKMEQALLLLEPIGEDANGEPIDSPDMEKFKKEYRDNIIKPCGDTDNACFKAAFIEFINTFTLSNGQTLGISYYEATFDSNGNIIAWTKK